MTITTNAYKLTFHIGEEQKHEGKPLFDAIVREARQRGLAGATVTRGLLGYGANSRVRSAHILALSEDLPIIVELIEQEDPLRELAEHFSDAVGKGVITLQPIEILNQR